MLGPERKSRQDRRPIWTNSLLPSGADGCNIAKKISDAAGASPPPAQRAGCLRAIQNTYAGLFSALPVLRSKMRLLPAKIRSCTNRQTPARVREWRQSNVYGETGNVPPRRGAFSLMVETENSLNWRPSPREEHVGPPSLPSSPKAARGLLSSWHP